MLQMNHQKSKRSKHSRAAKFYFNSTLIRCLGDFLLTIFWRSSEHIFCSYQTDLLLKEEKKVFHILTSREFGVCSRPHDWLTFETRFHVSEIPFLSVDIQHSNTALMFNTWIKLFPATCVCLTHSCTGPSHETWINPEFWPDSDRLNFMVHSFTLTTAQV